MTDRANPQLASWRLALMALVIAVATTLLAPLPATAGGAEDRPLRDGIQYGTSEWDSPRETAAAGDLVATGGQTRGELPGFTAAGGDDAFLRVSDPRLGTRWALQFGSGNHDYLRALDTDGRTVVAGGTAGGPLPGAHGVGPGWVGAWSADGSRRWLHQFSSGPDGTSFSRVNAVAISGSHLYVAGRTNNPTGFAVVLVQKRSLATGAVVWQRTLASDWADYVSGDAVTVLGDGVYVSGYVSGGLAPGAGAGGSDAFVARFDAADGDLRWTRQFGTAEDDITESGVPVTSDGSRIFVAGDLDHSSRAFVTAYSRTGRRLWMREFTGNRWAGVSGLAWTGDGLAVAGTVGGVLPGQTSHGGDDVFVRVYTRHGTLKWTRQLGTAARDLLGGIAHSRHGLYLGVGTQGSLAGPNQGNFDVAQLRFAASRPDAVAHRRGGAWRGNDRYLPTAQHAWSRVRRGRTAAFHVRLQNDGEETEPLRVRGCRDRRGLRIRFFRANGRQVTWAVRHGKWRSTVLRPGRRSFLKVKVSAFRRAPLRTRTCRLVVASTTQARVRDAITLKVLVVR